jgi:hypothetical protein
MRELISSLSLTTDQSFILTMMVGAMDIVMDHTELMENIMESINIFKLCVSLPLLHPQIFPNPIPSSTSAPHFLGLQLHLQHPQGTAVFTTAYEVGQVHEHEHDDPLADTDSDLTKSAEGSEYSHPSNEWVKDDGARYLQDWCLCSMHDNRCLAGVGGMYQSKEHDRISSGYYSSVRL